MGTCGAPRHDGHGTCTQPVAEPGVRCRFHRHAARAATVTPIRPGIRVPATAHSASAAADPFAGEPPRTVGARNDLARDRIDALAAQLAPGRADVIEVALADALAPWGDVRLRHDDAANWQFAGFGPATATAWDAAGLCADEAVDWHRAGFDPDDAGRWAAHAHLPDGAAAWRAAGVADPAAAAQWDRRFTPDDAAPWLAAGIGPLAAADHDDAGRAPATAAHARTAP